MSSKNKNRTLWTAEQRKKFRHDISQLKKKGLVSKKIDARKAVPTRALKAALKQFDDVLSHEARVFKLPKQFIPGYKNAGYRVKGGRVVLRQGEYVVPSGKEKGIIKSVAQKGHGPTITVRSFPYAPHTLDEFIELVASDPDRFHLQHNEQWGFRFFGWNSRKYFANFEEMIETIHAYNNIEAAYDNPDAMSELVANFEIVRIDPSQPWYALNDAKKKRDRRERVKVKKLGKKAKSRAEMNPVSAQLERERKAKYQREHYNSEKESKRKRDARAREKAKYVEWWKK